MRAFKIIFLSAIFIAISFSQNFVSAENIDWSKAKRITGKQELAFYLRECEKNFVTYIPVIIPKNLNIGDLEPIKDMIVLPELTTRRVSDENYNYIVYKIKCYPGSKVAYAYRTGKTSILDSEEVILYSKAVKIVREINKMPDEESKVAYIDLLLSAGVHYLHDVEKIKVGNMPHFTTAYGALIEGQANCQGFSDAFYMLGTMCGLKVDRVYGFAKNSSAGHAWNMVQYRDGKSYFIDTTWDGDNNTKEKGSIINFRYLNAPREIMEVTHIWKDEYLPMNNLQPKIDARYAFYADDVKKVNEMIIKSFGGIIRCSNLSAAIDRASKGFATEKYSICWIMTDKGSSYADADMAIAYFVKRFKTYSNKMMSFNLWKYDHGKYDFYIIKKS